MANPRSFLRKLQALNTDVLARESIQDTETVFTNLNQQQMYAGKRSPYASGSALEDIVPLYSTSYRQYKRKIGQPYDRVTLELTGAFYAAFVIEVGQDTIKEYSGDFKNDFLIKRYGLIFGLGGTYRAQYIAKLRVILMQKIRLQISQ